MFEKIKQTVLLKQYEIRKFDLTANVKNIDIVMLVTMVFKKTRIKNNKA